MNQRGNQINAISNNPLPYALPTGDCEIWYDGCNLCEITSGNLWHDLYMHCRKEECGRSTDMYCYMKFDDKYDEMPKVEMS